jgi:hypothetical protein
MFLFVNGTDSIIHFFVLASNDGGQHWETRYVFPPHTSLQHLQFISSQLGYITGGITGAKFWRTTDGGHTWNEISGFPSDKGLEISFSPGGKYGIVTEYNDAPFFVSTDSGFTWQKDSVIYNGNPQLLTPYFTDDSTAMVTSMVGFWTKTFGAPKSGVSTWTKAINPSLSIRTNPSPASTSVVHCKIEGLSTVSDKSISLKLYDLLGREVMDLTRSAQEGNNGSSSFFDIFTGSLSSGTYTLVLSTNNGGATNNILVWVK